jgi:hypothetical protein
MQCSIVLPNPPGGNIIVIIYILLCLSKFFVIREKIFVFI